MRKLISRRGLALLAVALAVCFTPAHAGKPQQAPDRGIYGANDGPVFLLITLDPSEQFIISGVDKTNGKFANECDELGSQMVVTLVGTNVAGFGIGDTTFVGSTANVPIGFLPPDENGLQPDLDGNAATIIGSFCTFAGDTHFTGPDPDPVAQPVQEAFFTASPGVMEAMGNGDLSPFPTTAEFAFFIYENQGDAGASFQDIEASIYKTSVQVNCTTCSAETDILPHDPPQRLFTSEFTFEEEGPDAGDVDLKMFINAGCDLKPGNSQNINLGSNGVFPFAFLTETRAEGADLNFDASTSIDTASIELFGEVDLPGGGTLLVGPIAIDKSVAQDVDGDTDLDLLVHFRTDLLEQAVVDAGLTDEALMNVVVNGLTTSGQALRCRESVRIVPPN